MLGGGCDILQVLDSVWASGSYRADRASSEHRGWLTVALGLLPCTAPGACILESPRQGKQPQPQSPLTGRPGSLELFTRRTEAEK